MENLAAMAGIKGGSATSVSSCAFSLLDKITGRSAGQLFREVPLPGSGYGGIGRPQGPLAPYLDLALRLESSEADAVHTARPPATVQAAVNRALLQALAGNGRTAKRRLKFSSARAPCRLTELLARSRFTQKSSGCPLRR